MLGNILDAIEESLEQLVAERDLPPSLAQGMAYVLLSGGKRIRPILALSIVADFGADWRPFVPEAIALELLHTSSLIHDDLPALDNDEMRRGRPSCHVKFGEATAILLGDFLVSEAFRMAISGGIKPASTQLKFVSILSEAFCLLCQGQELDIHRNEATSALEVEEINELKTAALFRASTSLGALAARVPDHALSQAEELGSNFGRLFQLIDDFSDAFIGQTQGRPYSSDQRNNKGTCFAGLSREQALLTLTEAQQDLVRAISGLQRSSEFQPNNLQRLIDELLALRGIAGTSAVLAS